MVAVFILAFFFLLLLLSIVPFCWVLYAWKLTVWCFSSCLLMPCCQPEDAGAQKAISKNLLCGSGCVGCGEVAGVFVASLFSPLCRGFATQAPTRLTALQCERMLLDYSEGPGWFCGGGSHLE